MTIRFETNDVLGKFTDDCAAIGKHLDANAEELKSAYARIETLKADLLECREYLEDHVDVVDGSDGPMPNRAMALVSMIDESLHGPGNF